MARTDDLLNDINKIDRFKRRTYDNFQSSEDIKKNKKKKKGMFTDLVDAAKRFFNRK